MGNTHACKVTLANSAVSYLQLAVVSDKEMFSVDARTFQMKIL
jgi:hypothetical protein